jgi:hypothetical protein
VNVPRNGIPEDTQNWQAQKEVKDVGAVPLMALREEEKDKTVGSGHLWVRTFDEAVSLKWSQAS